jgi:hypothetical protein
MPHMAERASARQRALAKIERDPNPIPDTGRAFAARQRLET